MKKNKSYLLIAAVLAFLFTVPSTQMLAQENIVDRLNKALSLKLPDNYDAEARKFIEEKEILKDEDVIDYTEKFFVEQMKEDLGINKQDQYLFLLSTCFEKCTRDYLYYAADGNDKRLDDYTTVMDKMNQCGDKYEEGLKAYLQQISAEYDRRSAEAKQRSAEAKQQSLNNITAIFKEVVNCYKLACSFNEFDKLEIFKPNVKDAIDVSKHFGFDYKAIIHELCGNETEVEKGFLKYFKIE